MDYTLLYSVGVDGFFQMISGPAGGFMVVVIGILVLNSRRKKLAATIPRKSGKSWGILPIVLLGLTGAVFAISNIISYSLLLLSLTTGHYKIAEGPITEYLPVVLRSDHHGQRDETFTVAGVTFDMNAQFVGFSQTQDEGSPLRAGDTVRIAYVFKGDQHPVIIRLEKAN